MSKPPHIIFIFADQWRAQSLGYAGNPDVKTPHLDRLAGESINLVQAVSGCPVCAPYRASLLTGQYPISHGIFLNDACLAPGISSLGKSFVGGGYQTAYIGKWHLDGHGRESYIPEDRRQGFQYWKVLECTHQYNRSAYYAGNSTQKQYWEGYDAFAQTRDACRFIRENKEGRPFFLTLSWGPPHTPYDTAPAEYRALYDPEKLALRPNVPASHEAAARRDLAGYYAHCSALDACMGELLAVLKSEKMEDQVLLVFTSDHGDMLGSHGGINKQQPWEESCRVPFLIRGPGLTEKGGCERDALLDAPDIMPSLLGLAGIPIPETVQGLDFSDYLRGGSDPSDGAALLNCVSPFGQWNRALGGREYRGVRTQRFTYVRSLEERPWLFYDNQKDPYQMRNLARDPEHEKVSRHLDSLLDRKLTVLGDDFLPGDDYVRKWNYPVDEAGTLPNH